MTRQILLPHRIEQGVQQSRIADVDLGRLDLTLLQILEPRGQRPDHERPGENVEIPARRPLARTERPRQLRPVPDLSMVVRDHRPEAAQRFRRDRDAELRNVALEERADETLAPERRGLDVPGEVGAGKSAAQPERPPRVGGHLPQIESGEVNASDAARQRFRHALDEGRRGAAEQQEPRAVVRPIDEHADGLEEGREPLHLVDDHQPRQATERLLRHGQPPAIDRRFQIEVRPARCVGRDGSGQGRLATLARSGQGHDRMNGERLPDARGRRWTLNCHTP